MLDVWDMYVLCNYSQNIITYLLSTLLETRQTELVIVCTPLLSTTMYVSHTLILSYQVSLVLRFMAKKLYAFASGECMAESTDSPMNQEILLGGHFYLMVLKV